MKSLISISALLLWGLTLFGQGIQFDQSNITIKPVLVIQGWGTYTNGAEEFDEFTNRYEPVDDRLNFQLRRTNFGFKGTAYDRFKFAFVGTADFVGKDGLSGTVGATNNGANPFFRLWVANLSWKALASSDLLHVTFGYMPPQVSRESISSAYRISSFEKSWSQNYIRRHLVGTGPGRAVGLNVGGMKNWEGVPWAISYNVGLFNPTYDAFGGNSTGKDHSPLFAYRLAIHIGDPEFESYSMGRKSNYFGKRNGLTFAISGSQNGEMAAWNTNQSIGFDLLFNWKNFNLSGEWMRLYRDASSTVSSTSYAGFARASYNFVAGKVIVEPSVNYVFFEGEMSQQGQEAASLLGSPFGKDNYWEIVLNAHLNANTKLSVGYIFRDGDPGYFNIGSSANNYFFQNGIGRIRRGNYLGLGFVFILG